MNIEQLESELTPLRTALNNHKLYKALDSIEDVKVFMKTYGQEVKINSSFPEEKIIKLRCDLIQEELDELKIAIEQKNILEVADALTDLLYVPATLPATKFPFLLI